MAAASCWDSLGLVLLWSQGLAAAPHNDQHNKTCQQHARPHAHANAHSQPEVAGSGRLGDCTRHLWGAILGHKRRRGEELPCITGDSVAQSSQVCSRRRREGNVDNDGSCKTSRSMASEYA